MIIEVLHPRSGAVVSRARVDVFPFTVGRALDSALVLDDPHIDARHARLVLEEGPGALLIEDLGSVNGVLTAARTRVPVVRLQSGAEVTLGRTRLRFRDEADPVPAALPLFAAAFAVATPWHERTAVRLIACAAVFALLGFEVWLSSSAPSGANLALMSVLGFAAMNAMWAGIWAAVGRVVIHQARFVAHLTIATMSLLAGLVVSMVMAWVMFLFPGTTAWGGVSVVLFLVVLAANVAWHLGNATAMSPARRRRTGAVVSGIVLALGGVFALADDGAFTDVPEFSAVIKPLTPRFVPTVSVEALRAVHAELREAVDRSAEEAER